jgi:hypothetical protein
MSQIKESLVSLHHSLNVGEKLRCKHDLRPCSVVLDRLDLSVSIETEAKIQRKSQRTDDAGWNTPVAKRSPIDTERSPIPEPRDPRSRRETSVVVSLYGVP